MIQLCRKDKEKVYEAIRAEKIDTADMALPNLIDDIILTIKKHGLLEPLSGVLEDKCRDNHRIPFDILLCFAVTAKLKTKTILTDVPFAVNDAELGWNVLDNGLDINKGLFSESVLCKLLAKYSSDEWISFYNDYVQKYLLKKLDTCPCIYILDCTKIPVNLQNENYEESSVVKMNGEAVHRYKLGVLRGIMGDSGVVEEISFGTLKIHDLKLNRDMLKTTSYSKENDMSSCHVK